MAKFDLTTRANTLSSMSKVFAKKWPHGLPKTAKIRGPGGTTILIRGNASGNLADSRWGGLTATWANAMDLPTWTKELRCGYGMARKGATQAAIKKACTIKRR
ncbi:hypothetical protein LCGC14_1112810 [marine sediment metagenome]|uniref:Uncharacterized protein n=1 Tax=marine sediment metagenome TaxID=412755 RepID=A0A0F9QCC7_9ZZZZ